MKAQPNLIAHNRVGSATADISPQRFGYAHQLYYLTAGSHRAGRITSLSSVKSFDIAAQNRCE